MYNFSAITNTADDRN